jgi:hypothetical protein
MNEMCLVYDLENVPAKLARDYGSDWKYSNKVSEENPGPMIFSEPVSQ